MLVSKLTRTGPRALLGQLQLSFLLLTNVWCYAALAPYKRLLAAMCRSKLAIASPERFPSGQANDNVSFENGPA